MKKCNHCPTLKKLFKEKCKECKDKYGFIAIAHVVDNHSGIYGTNVEVQGISENAYHYSSTRVRARVMASTRRDE